MYMELVSFGQLISYNESIPHEKQKRRAVLHMFGLGSGS